MNEKKKKKKVSGNKIDALLADFRYEIEYAREGKDRQGWRGRKDPPFAGDVALARSAIPGVAIWRGG